MSQATIIHLKEAMFSEAAWVLLEQAGFRAVCKRFASGVAALTLATERVELLLLPFQGQQIWSAKVDGRELTMRSMCHEPRAGVPFLETYGAFLLHCGANAMGGPGETDSHPLHGELPNAYYQEAYLVLGEDAQGRYLGLGGCYQHSAAFSCNYLAKPLVKIYQHSSTFSMEMEIANLKQSTMELMYLAHINFRPVDHGELVYSAQVNPEDVRIRQNIPAHIKPDPDYLALLHELGQQPEKHHHFEPGVRYDPEVVFIINYLADAEGWAHSMQVRPDGTADYMRHRPEQLRYGVRWISRTPDQDALGMADPATAEPDGYSAEKAKGNILELAAGGSWRCEVAMGVLDQQETARMRKHILSIVQGS
jgi:hypothetical protein